MFRAQETGGVFKISDLVPVERKLRELFLDLAGIENSMFDPKLSGGIDRRVQEIGVSMQRMFTGDLHYQSACDGQEICSRLAFQLAPNLDERSANGTNCSPSPIACRVIRVSPLEDPNECGGAYLSIPITLAPPPAMAACVPAFSIYKAFSDGSFNRRAGRFAFFRFLKPCLPAGSGIGCLYPYCL